MIRAIRSNRLPTDSAHGHYCTLHGERITAERCMLCEYNRGIEKNPKSYEAKCAYDIGIDILPQIEPMKAWEVKDLPAYVGKGSADVFGIVNRDRWEPKYDGVRALIHFTEEGVRVTGRRKSKEGIYSEMTDKFPHLVLDRQLVGAVFDAEAMMRNDEGLTLKSTMGVVNSEVNRAIEIQVERGWMQFYVFDLLIAPGGMDLRDETLLHRLDILGSVMSGGLEYMNLVVGKTLVTEGERRRYFDECLRLGFEGCVAKSFDSRYGERYGWIKVKEKITVDMQVVGFEYGQRGSKYEQTVGTLKVAVIDGATGRLRQVAKVVPGNDAMRESLFRRFEGLTDREITALRMIVELEGQSWTEDLMVRHPRILRYRPDLGMPNVINFDEVMKR